MTAKHDKALRLISRAWGRTQRGYCFFPYIDREEQKRTGSRRAGFNEGPAFKWPRDRARILAHLEEHEHHDLYWCPSLFEYPQRNENLAMDEHALWADLDEVDPRNIDSDLRPTIAWETSEGRFQALWVAGSGDFQGASWPGNENQRLTYLLGADLGGWDTVQLLRVPGWKNHKLDRQGDQGRLLWSDGPLYYPGDFKDLPEVRGAVDPGLSDALEEEIDHIDRHQVLARIKLRLPHRARELLNAKEISGDRSGQQWWLTRCLADVGCSLAEIVAIIRALPWNKFKDRSDELRVLISEAAKAISSKGEDSDGVEVIDEDVQREAPQRLGQVLANVRRPIFLVEGVLTEGSCGFIAGEPKSFKSWIGLDLALSVASGADFMGEFRINNPGPVFYIQEEDPPPVLKSRSAKIWAGKATDKLRLVTDPAFGMPQVEWLPPEAEKEFDPDVAAYIQKGFIISDEAWMLWLDEELEKGMDGEPYRLLLIDTLMMTAGEVDENRAQEMTTKIFKPLKTLARKYNTGVMVVHHLGKGDKARIGQRMLGSVANHAWSEDSLYIQRSPGGDLKLELESKSAPAGVWRIGNLDNTAWEPAVMPWKKEEKRARDTNRPASASRSDASTGARARQEAANKALRALDEVGGVMTARQVADAAGISYQQAHRQLKRASERGQVYKDPAGKWGLNK